MTIVCSYVLQSYTTLTRTFLSELHTIRVNLRKPRPIYYNELYLTPQCLCRLSIGYKFVYIHGIPVPKFQEKILSIILGRVLSKIVQNSTILYIFCQNFSGGGPPDPPISHNFISLQFRNTYTFNIAKKLPGMTIKRCKAPHYLSLPCLFIFLFKTVRKTKLHICMHSLIGAGGGG